MASHRRPTRPRPPRRGRGVLREVADQFLASIATGALVAFALTVFAVA